MHTSQWPGWYSFLNFDVKLFNMKLLQCCHVTDIVAILQNKTK